MFAIPKGRLRRGRSVPRRGVRVKESSRDGVRASFGVGAPASSGAVGETSHRRVFLARGRRGGGAVACFSGAFPPVRSISIVHSVRTAARAPIAARAGAARAPTTPTVRGNSATLLPWCWITIRRTFPSRTRSMTLSSSSAPSTLTDSQRVFAGMPPPNLCPRSPHRDLGDQDGGQPHPHRHRLPGLGTDPHSLVQLQVVADAGDPGQDVGPVADEGGPHHGGADPPVLDQIGFGGGKDELAASDVHLAAAEA